MNVQKLEALAKTATKGERIIAEEYYDGPLYYINVLKAPDKELVISLTSSPSHTDPEATTRLSISSTPDDEFGRMVEQDRIDAEYTAATDPDTILRIIKVLQSMHIYADAGFRYGTKEDDSTRSMAEVLNYHRAMFSNIIGLAKNLGLALPTDDSSV